MGTSSSPAQGDAEEGGLGEAEEEAASEPENELSGAEEQLLVEKGRRVLLPAFRTVGATWCLHSTCFIVTASMIGAVFALRSRVPHWHVGLPPRSSGSSPSLAEELPHSTSAPAHRLAALAIRNRADGCPRQHGAEGPADAPCFLRPGAAVLASREVRDDVAACVLQAGHSFLEPADRALTAQAVDALLANVSTGLGRGAPGVARGLDRVGLSQGETEAALSTLRLLGNERVQGIGREVAQAIYHSPSADGMYLRQAIEEQLQPKTWELRTLLREVVPASLRRLWQSQGGRQRVQWELTLDTENIHCMWGGRPHAAQGASSSRSLAALGHREKYAAAAGGALEATKVLLDMLQKCAGSDGPPWAAVLGGHGAIAGLPRPQPPPAWPCEAGAAAALGPARERGGADALKEVLCSLKFGVQGLEALRAAEEAELEDVDDAVAMARDAELGDDDLSLV